MPAECLGISLGVLAGTLGVLGILWYSGRENDSGSNKKSIKKKKRYSIKQSKRTCNIYLNNVKTKRLQDVIF